MEGSRKMSTQCRQWIYKRDTHFIFTLKIKKLNGIFLFIYLCITSSNTGSIFYIYICSVCTELYSKSQKDTHLFMQLSCDHKKKYRKSFWFPFFLSLFDVPFILKCCCSCYLFLPSPRHIFTSKWKILIKSFENNFCILRVPIYE